MTSATIRKLYNQPSLFQNKAHLSKIVCSKLNNLDKLMKNPCSIFLATEENEQNNNNNTFLEDDVYFYLTLHENQNISFIEESSPKHNHKKKEIQDNFEELDNELIDSGPMILNLKVPESISPKLFRQIN